MTQEELELMREYIPGVCLGIINMSFNDFIESKKEPKVMSEEMLNEEVTQEIKPVEWIDKIYYLVDKVDSLTEKVNLISEVVLDCVEDELEPDSDCLDTYAYKAKVLANNEIEMVKIGKIDSFGKLELFAVETYPPIVPSFYQPEFYYLGMESKDVKRYGVSHTQPQATYKKFVPKNLINQIVISKEDIKYSTGYINAEGVAIYYDQLPKNVKDEVKKNDK